MPQFTDEVKQFQWTIKYFTGIPTDVITNSWHMIFDNGGSAPSGSDYTAACNALQTFYNSMYGVASLAQWVDKTSASIKVYDLTLAPPRVPVHTQAVPVTNTQTAGYTPTEVAMCLSFKGTYVSGIDTARQRGRVYLGGFSQVTSNGGTTTFPTINSTIRSTVCTAASTLKGALATANWIWVVASNAQVASPQGAGFQTFDVTGGWIDDTPDTQRRRGLKTTVRSTF